MSGTGLWLAVDIYASRPENIYGPFESEEVAQDYADARTPIGSWFVRELRMAEPHDPEVDP